MRTRQDRHQGFWAEAIETSMDGFWMVDGRGRLLEVNEAYIRRSGYSREELLGMSVSDLEAVETAEQTTRHIEWIRRRGYDRFESLHRAKDGTAWPVEVAASWRPDGNGTIFAFLRDIGDRREAERALRQHREFLQSIIASSADCIKVLDLSGNLLSMSAGGRRRLEIEDVERYLNRCWTDFWQEQDRPAVREAIAMARHGKQGQFQGYCPSEKGMPKWWDVIVTPISGVDGGVERLLAVSRDVTERKLFEDALKTAKTEAERANNAKSRFLAATGHDLRQPFQAMRLLYEALRPHVQPAGAAAYAKLDEAMRAGEKLLSALLDVSLLEVGMVKVRMQAVPIDELLAGLVRECAPEAQMKGLRLRYVACGRRLYVESDPVMLARMLRNLLLNAIRYTDRGSVLVGCRRRGERVSILVCDSGIGVSEADLPHLFEEFYQVGNSERDRTKGLGLGLAVVAKTAKLLGHHLDVRSALGKGSVFSVSVPRCRPDRGEVTTNAPMSCASA